MNWYDAFPSSAPLNIFAAFGLLCLALGALWRSGTAGSKRLPYVLMAILMGVTGATLLATSTYLGLLQISFAEAVANGSDLPEKTAPIAILAHAATLAVLIGLMVTAILKRHIIAVAGMCTLAALACTSLCELIQFRLFTDDWALAVTVSWLLAIITLISFAVTVATVMIRAYGDRQHAKGYQAAVHEHRIVLGTPYADAVPAASQKTDAV